MEPSYRWPDAYLEVPRKLRRYLTSFSKDDGRIRSADDAECRHFLRVLLSMPIRGENGDCVWGVWVEVASADWERAYDLWDDPRQADVPPFPAALANSLRGFEQTLGLRGQVKLVGPGSPPTFTIDREVAHPLAETQHEGVESDRLAELLSIHHHS